MKHTKGTFDLSSDEFKSRNLLAKMLLLDAKMSDIGTAISELKTQYILENCKFKVGDKIEYMHYTNNYKCGVISHIYYSLNNSFFYSIERLNKGFVKPDSFKSHITIHPSKQWEAIKKAELK